MVKGSTRVSLPSLLSKAWSLTFRRRSLIIKTSLLGSNQSLMSRRDLTARASLLSPFPNSS